MRGQHIGDAARYGHDELRTIGRPVGQPTATTVHTPDRQRRPGSSPDRPGPLTAARPHMPRRAGAQPR
nr:hypothetical protein JVH1_9028 [Rhodococcus sp. JVH1]